MECGFCSDVSCDQLTGKCSSPCIGGYYGDNCNTDCIHTGCKTCNRSTGECDECKAGLWTNDCSESCSQACIASADSFAYCDKVSGDCTIRACSPGYYAENCMLECNDNCLADSNNDIHCDFLTGSCRDGCNSGFYGSYCNLTCSPNCVGGICNRNGECLRNLGCVKEYYGFDCGLNCNTTCNDGSCHRDDGICDECRKIPEEQTPLCRTAGMYYYDLSRKM